MGISDSKEKRRKKLSFENYRHNHGSTSCEEKAVFCNLTTKCMHKFCTFETGIFDNLIFIDFSDS